MSAHNDVPRWLPKHLFPFQNRFIQIDGHQIHYVDEGSGPTLLFLHGNPTWSFLYRDIIDALQTRFRCVALDYPGFGLSKAAPGYDFRPVSHARVVEAFVEALGLQKITLMVHNWGGPIGLWVAERHPALLRAVVIGNTWAWPVDGDPHFERFSKWVGGRLGGVLIRHLNAFVNVMLPFGVRRKRLSAEVMAAYRKPLRTPESRKPTHVFPHEIRMSSSFLRDVESHLESLADVPALIVWGDEDAAFRAQERARFEQLFSHHRTHTLHGAGHYIQEDAALEIASAIIAWWDEVVAQPPTPKEPSARIDAPSSRRPPARP